MEGAILKWCTGKKREKEKKSISNIMIQTQVTETCQVFHLIAASYSAALAGTAERSFGEKRGGETGLVGVDANPRGPSPD